MDKENEYKEMFLAEALENYEELNKLFTALEKEHNNKKIIDEIFRITHTMKGNAMGMGFEGITGISHVLEDVFSEAKTGGIVLDQSLFDILFKTLDKLGELINAIHTNEEVKYKGIKTKLEVFLRNIKPINSQILRSEPNEILKIDPTNTESLHVADHNETEPEEESHAKISFSDLVQIPVRKLDGLLNLVGELIIERDGLIARGIEKGNSTSEYARLQRITSDLQYGVMDVRLVQIGFLFNKFHRVLRDAANIEGKKVNLILEGTEIEIDRNILKIMSDSLIHLIRNSVGHGIEKPSARKVAGKDEVGKVYLKARNEKDNVIIEITDDGNGIDANAIKRKAIEKGILTKEYADTLTKDEIIQIIFEPGFSNAEKITEVSGRGVGMDVVKRATESIGGKIHVETELGKGSTITLILPSSMAVKGALLFLLNQQEYAVPLTYTEAVISIKKQDIHLVSSGLISKYLGKTISVIFLKDLFAMNTLEDMYKENLFHKSFFEWNDSEKLELMVVSYNNKLFGLVVDKLLQQKEIVEKALSKPIDTLELFSGATILGNGSICLVLDVATISKACFKDRFIQKV
ncbi:MAG TPA: chemotaxis protein CheA [Cytophagaceae bacterium]|jgi:two-component system chemotaxis sensor kinase CheA|nr:chemotaxis protein CheA [Cytophagaceae bacterium]